MSNFSRAWLTSEFVVCSIVVMPVQELGTLGAELEIPAGCALLEPERPTSVLEVADGATPHPFARHHPTVCLHSVYSAF